MPGLSLIWRGFMNCLTQGQSPFPFSGIYGTTGVVPFRLLLPCPFGLSDVNCHWVLRWPIWGVLFAHGYAGAAMELDAGFRSFEHSINCRPLRDVFGARCAQGSQADRHEKLNPMAARLERVAMGFRLWSLSIPLIADEACGLTCPGLSPVPVRTAMQSPGRLRFPTSA